MQRKKIQLYDTKTKKIRTLQPVRNSSVHIYSCGPTVYQRAHIGNMRPYILADTLNRALRHFGYTPKHVINFTDVGHLTDDADAGEDKIEKEARKSSRRAGDIAEEFSNLFLRDLQKLHVPVQRYRFPKATEYIQEQIHLIKKIEEKGYTYTIRDGIYFDTQAYPHYGAFGLPMADKKNEYARIQQITGKKHPRDFALWKLTPEGLSRQQEWDSPWGRGFPGWHIECSAMAMHLLDETIDIHTGGMDHIAIHHTNEIAQSESVTDKPLANIWMHTAFLTDSSEKISKSTGNTYTTDDLERKGYSPLALRYLFLLSSYRTPISFSFTALTAAQTALERLNDEYASFPRPLFPFLNTKPDPELCERINAAVADDLNTAKVLALLQNVLRDKTLTQKQKRAVLSYADGVLGILVPKKINRPVRIPKEVRTLLAQRDAARKNNNYTLADSIRDQIHALGYDVTDADGTSTVTERKGW